MNKRTLFLSTLAVLTAAAVFAGGFFTANRGRTQEAGENLDIALDNVPEVSVSSTLPPSTTMAPASVSSTLPPSTTMAPPPTQPQLTPTPTTFVYSSGPPGSNIYIYIEGDEIKVLGGTAQGGNGGIGGNASADGASDEVKIETDLKPLAEAATGRTSVVNTIEPTTPTKITSSTAPTGPTASTLSIDPTPPAAPPETTSSTAPTGPTASTLPIDPIPPTLNDGNCLQLITTASYPSPAIVVSARYTIQYEVCYGGFPDERETLSLRVRDSFVESVGLPFGSSVVETRPATVIYDNDNQNSGSIAGSAAVMQCIEIPVYGGLPCSSHVINLRIPIPLKLTDWEGPWRCGTFYWICNSELVTDWP